MKNANLDQTVKAYILSCIDGDAYGVECKTNQEKIDFLKHCFENEYLFPANLARYGSVQNVLAEYFMGLPSVFNLAFYNHDILALAVEWGSLPENATEKQEQKILDNYFQFLAAKTMQLFNGYRIPKDSE